jgi:hypothetical protein
MRAGYLFTSPSRRPSPQPFFVLPLSLPLGSPLAV